jgi:hypothetical protein
MSVEAAEKSRRQGYALQMQRQAEGWLRGIVGMSLIGGNPIECGTLNHCLAVSKNLWVFYVIGMKQEP